jgi:MraZ protein
VSFPPRLRTEFPEDVIVITRGLEKCLYLFPRPVWIEFAGALESPPVFSRDWRKMQRHFLGWATEAEIDRSGRLAIPQSLREYAGLSRELIVMGLGRRVELWDAALYGGAHEGEDGEAMEAVAERCGIVF